MARLLRSPSGLTGMIILVLLNALTSVFAILGWLPYPPLEQHAADRLTGPCSSILVRDRSVRARHHIRVMAAVAATLRVAIIGVAIAAGR